MVAQKKIQQIIDIIIEKAHPEKIILFGSHARGDSTFDSDVDILIVKESNLPRHKRANEIRKHLRGLKIPLDIIVYTQDEIEKWRNVKNAFVRNVLREGKVVYG